ncbi:LOW QUALITY PROTEIN: hypothetical protein KIPB_009015 [Kipferlia bialata]|uniref:glutathione transferase n=1 Tax=Kipferlia bialata TaxID=797122 RepID=A0A9K3D2Z0_9EUKA|nr:LOW QUALITY PROTEIN: hypothetical protein KIPB_003268 [Kipferlia bialata]GIQ87051.1 LOW QUALITY PROTEIN: hypothetical protein KIPB_009015 [Kipferlia bialata]
MVELLRGIYFNVPGRAEAVRLMYALAGVALEDMTVPSKEEWLSDIKPRMTASGELPFSQLPQFVLGLVPSDDLRAYEGQMVVAELASIQDLMYYVFRGYIKETEEPSLVSSRMIGLSYVDRMVAKEHGPFFAGDTPTYVDCIAVAILSTLVKRGFIKLSDFPALEELHTAFTALPAIQAYMTRDEVDEME